MIDTATLKNSFPGCILPNTHEIFGWMTVSSWYLRSWDSLYFDVLYRDSKLQSFKIIIKPDLSDASLHVINISETISDDLINP